MSVKFSVDSVCNGKSHCHFARQIEILDSVSLDTESIVSVLHFLYSSIPHEVNVKFQFQ